MSHVLRPCPFCGRGASLIENEGNENWPRRFWIECNNAENCGAKSRGFFGASAYATGPATLLNDMAKRDLVEWWNRRAGETP